MLLKLFVIGIIRCQIILDLRSLFGKEEQTEHLSFVAVIDAGSTGSRFNFYGFNKLRLLEYFYFETIEPGISTLSTKDIIVYLDKLLERVENNLKRLGVDVRKIPLAFQATAGLRLLPGSESKKLLIAVKTFFKEYNAKGKNIGIISGADEGLFALRSLLLLKKLEHWAVKKYGCQKLIVKKNMHIDNDYCEEVEAHLKHTHTYGIIDMGGGSVQLSYVDEKNDKFFSQSFLGFGLNESMKVIKRNPSYEKCRESQSVNTKECREVFSSLFGSKKPTHNTENINYVHEIYLVSYFYDKFFEFGGYKKSINDIENDFREKCNSLNEQDCFETQFLIFMLKYFKFNKNTIFFIIKDVMGVNLNWSVAKGYDLIKNSGFFVDEE